jgi:4-aminobutyrate aminotransferase
MAMENFGVRADIVCFEFHGEGRYWNPGVKPDGSIDPDTRDRIVVEGFKEGIVLLPCGDSAIRFSPPLVITKDEADTGLDRFEAALKKVFA